MRFYSLIITLAISFISIKSYAQTIPCSACEGTGKMKSLGTCPNCEYWNSEYRRKVPCHVCKDTRRAVTRVFCLFCKGVGRVTPLKKNWQFNEAVKVESTCKVTDKKGNNIELNIPIFYYEGGEDDGRLYFSDGNVFGLPESFRNIKDECDNFDGSPSFGGYCPSMMWSAERTKYEGQYERVKPYAIHVSQYRKPWEVYGGKGDSEVHLTLSQSSPSCLIKAFAICILLQQNK